LPKIESSIKEEENILMNIRSKEVKKIRIKNEMDKMYKMDEMDENSEKI